MLQHCLRKAQAVPEPPSRGGRGVDFRGQWLLGARQIPAAMMASARIGTVCAFSPAMFIRLSPIM